MATEPASIHGSLQKIGSVENLTKGQEIIVGGEYDSLLDHKAYGHGGQILKGQHSHLATIDV